MNWISTEDRSPDYGKIVLIHHSNGTIFIARRKECTTEKYGTNERFNIKITDRYCEVVQSQSGGYSFSDREITHWMPLPQVPL